MANGKFVLDKGRTGKFRFNLFATNGRVIATSEAYDSKAAALKGLAAVQRLAAGATVLDRTNGAVAKAATAKKTVAKKSGAKKATKGAAKKARATAKS
jgi:uncharacterized protein